MDLGNTDDILRIQTTVLEAVACGTPLVVVADLICRQAEALAPDVICSILTVDTNSILHNLASPSLPLAFSSEIEGLPIGPDVGCCGTAAFRREPVMVTDIETDPLWANYRQFATPLGLRACWSSPVLAQDGSVVATFAFYYRTNRAPDDLERRLVQACVHMLAIAIENERTRQRNQRLAYYDVLTGLPNRGEFNRLLSRCVSLKEKFGLLLVDIDHLKNVNDSLGHAMGDMLIKTVAQRIADCDPRMTACRLGGDEFAVIVAECSDARTLETRANALLMAASGRIPAGDHSLEPHITIGGALSGQDGDDEASLTQNADFALYHAKETRRGSYVHFDPLLRISMLERATKVRNLDRALIDKRIEAYYQPIVRIDTREIVGLEALVRMVMPDGRVSEAGEFHEGLGDSRIAYEITGQMLTQIARDVRAWLDQGVPLQHVGVNVTTGDFQRGDLETRIVDAFGSLDVPLTHIILEVNEAVYMSGGDQTIPKAVTALRERGLLVALDDFGTGYASLTHLLSFPVDIIKIDKSFIDRLGSDGPSAVIVGGIIDIARQLDMKVVAEGIETTSQSAALTLLGCNLGQGFLYARPMPFDEITALMKMFAQRPAEAPRDLIHLLQTPAT